MKLRTEPSKNNKKFNCARFFLIGLLCIFISPVSASAKNLEQYREKVRYARDLTISILYPDEENMAGNSQISEAKALTEIRQSIPVSEKIEWQGASVETNNLWLVDNLAGFEREPPTSPKRRLILTAVSERLDALDRKLAELESLSAPNRAKDEDKQKLAEILRREEYQKPEKEESFFQKIYRKIAEWLESFFPRPDVSGASLNGFQSLSFVLQMLLYALVLGVIGFLIYKFAPFIAGRFPLNVKKEKNERVILGERLSADETAENLFAEAESLAAQGNLRGAIRKGYIALLCQLNDRKIIGLSRHKTNRDYLRDIRGRAELYRNLNGLTLNFERHWYGFELAKETDWEEFKNDYRRAISENP